MKHVFDFLRYELWLDSEIDSTESGADIFPGIAANHSKILDQGAVIDGPLFNESNGYVGKLSGFFIAPYTGEFQFYLDSHDSSALYMAINSSLGWVNFSKKN